MRDHVVAAMVLANLVLAACQSGQQQAPADGTQTHADRVLQGGKIFTVDDDQPWAQAVAIRDGKFVYVGNDAGVESFVGPETALHDLQGKLVIPGLVDAHTHPGGMGRFPEPAPLPVTSKEDILAAVKAYSEANPDLPWIKMCCWPVYLYGNGKDGPHKRDLDAIVPDRPVWLGSDVGHSIWVNSAALQMMGVDRNTPDPLPGVSLFGRDADGELTGWIKEKTYRPYIRKFFEVDKETNQKGTLEFLEYLTRHGVTSLYDAGNTYYHDDVYSFLAEL
ncbi:MAG: amidohydrolase family protein, partial [Acidobacteriota bacterium]